ncbi:MAG: hypothetical protein L0287_30660 [Anaerolineae bacterium]|nr:hypothetical protein [Anaerolineae bacterium]MCI0610374.1 hypothetical protein [Anaerolineae bacterium]
MKKRWLKLCLILLFVDGERYVLLDTYVEGDAILPQLKTTPIKSQTQWRFAI